MYLEHFGLKEFPFSLTPDTSFFFAYGHYRDALDTLLVALRNGEGFIKVTGEVGTGKTLLCRMLLNSLEEKFYTAYIPNPYMSAEALNLALADELNLELESGLSQHRVIKELTRRLVELHKKGKRVVLCIDEAQAMPAETLEALRLLTNLETEKRKLLQVVLFGQPELDERLSAHSARQLRQRITFSYSLQPLDRDGMDAYVNYRLTVAGNRGSVQLKSSALRALYRASGGFPRLVNILAHKSLMAAYGKGERELSAKHVGLAENDTEGVMRSASGNRWWPSAIAASLLLAGGVGAYLLFQGSPWTPVSDSVAMVTQESEPVTAPSTPAVVTTEPTRAKPEPVTITPEPEAKVTASVAELPESVTDTTTEVYDIDPAPVVAMSPVVVDNVFPQATHGSLESRTFSLLGDGFMPQMRLEVVWRDGHRFKQLSDEQVTFVSSERIDFTITTGTRPDRWRVRLIDPDHGVRGESQFLIVDAADPVPQRITVQKSRWVERVSVSPDSLLGSYVRQAFSIQGDDFQPDTEIEVSWAGGSKRLDRDQVRFVSPERIDFYITTGESADYWLVRMIDPMRGTIGESGFRVIAPSVNERAAAPAEEPTELVEIKRVAEERL